jgi:putative heme iron utilization protein
MPSRSCSVPAVSLASRSRPCVSNDSKTADAILMKFRIWGNFTDMCKIFEILIDEGSKLPTLYPRM